jgi:hypothetical protein
MTTSFVSSQQLDEVALDRVQVVNPYRGVNQYH